MDKFNQKTMSKLNMGYTENSANDIEGEKASDLTTTHSRDPVPVLGEET